MTCSQLADKNNGRIIYTEVCGCKAKYILTYTLREKPVVKTVCKKHLNSNKNWLGKISVVYEVKDI